MLTLMILIDLKNQKILILRDFFGVFWLQKSELQRNGWR